MTLRRLGIVKETVRETGLPVSENKGEKSVAFILVLVVFQDWTSHPNTVLWFIHGCLEGKAGYFQFYQLRPLLNLVKCFDMWYKHIYSCHSQTI